MEIGATIKKLRGDRHIKQESFAEALGVSVQTVSRWENDVNYPDIAMLPQIASFFQVRRIKNQDITNKPVCIGHRNSVVRFKPV